MNVVAWLSTFVPKRTRPLGSMRPRGVGSVMPFQNALYTYTVAGCQYNIRAICVCKVRPATMPHCLAPETPVTPTPSNRPSLTCG